MAFEFAILIYRSSLVTPESSFLKVVEEGVTVAPSLGNMQNLGVG